MLLKYRPEDKAAKKERLLKRAQAEADGKPVEAKKPIVVKYGLNHVTYLIEQVMLWFIIHLIYSYKRLVFLIFPPEYELFEIHFPPRTRLSWWLLLMM